VDEADLEGDKEEDDPLKTLEKAVTESKIHDSYKMEIDHLKQQLTAMQGVPDHEPHVDHIWQSPTSLEPDALDPGKVLDLAHDYLHL